jgi:hypothetical protein
VTGVSLAVSIAIGLLLVMLAAQHMGRRLGRRRFEKFGDEVITSGGTIDAAVFGLLGLLIAFTFTGASARYDARRLLVVDQVNALSTAWSRLDLLPGDERDEARQLLRRYIDALYEASVNTGDDAAVAAFVDEARDVEHELWQFAVDAAKRAGQTHFFSVMLPSLNEAFDLSNSRLSATRIHVQVEVVVFLCLLAALSAFLVGHSQGASLRGSPMHSLMYCVLMSVALYVILDFEFPSFGLIRLDSGWEFMQEFRANLE